MPIGILASSFNLNLALVLSKKNTYIHTRCVRKPEALLSG
jgi:hypothetical protein